MKFWILVDSTTMGINLWLIPQISEHWPKYSPGRCMIIRDWFSRPGVESILIPIEGTVHAWMTSIDVDSSRIGKLKGIMHRLSTSKRRNSFNWSWLEGVINEVNSILKKSVYSYFQYHWWAMHLMVVAFWFMSSIKYNSLIEGIARKIRMIIGMMVQIISIKWFWSRNRLINLFLINEVRVSRIIMVINVIIIIVKSWKNIIISQIGELESCIVKDHVFIFNKRLIFIYEF